MTKDQIMQLINDNPIFALATMDGTRPRVRNMLTCFTDDRGIIFCTGKSKEVYLQIINNPALELCYMDGGKETQVRIEATAEEIDDLDLKKAIVEKFTFLQSWIDQVGYEGMAVFTFKEARACVWTMETSNEAKEYINL
ncbi:MAG: pyridoxamine 5'-phosphate oxidase family protein [Sedimentisphaerales bacterium]|nr:pyridoxamine 5'-phosphate oxidase family protein [Sedimentisphaerales bacterium]